jgi:hypothetical protein
MYFAEVYGCDVEIRLFKYDRVEDLQDFNYRMNTPLFASFFIDDNSYYNIYKEKFLSMEPEERKKKEMEMMTSH